jgi:hypothetical protein
MDRVTSVELYPHSVAAIDEPSPHTRGVRLSSDCLLAGLGLQAARFRNEWLRSESYCRIRPRPSVGTFFHANLGQFWAG